MARRHVLDGSEALARRRRSRGQARRFGVAEALGRDGAPDVGRVVPLEEPVTAVQKVEAVVAHVESSLLGRVRARATSGSPDECAMFSGRAATTATDA